MNFDWLNVLVVPLIGAILVGAIKDIMQLLGHKPFQQQQDRQTYLLERITEQLAVLSLEQASILEQRLTPKEKQTVQDIFQPERKERDGNLQSTRQPLG